MTGSHYAVRRWFLATLSLDAVLLISATVKSLGTKRRPNTREIDVCDADGSKSWHMARPTNRGSVFYQSGHRKWVEISPLNVISSAVFRCLLTYVIEYRQQIDFRSSSSSSTAYTTCQNHSRSVSSFMVFFHSLWLPTELLTPHKTHSIDRIEKEETFCVNNLPFVPAINLLCDQNDAVSGREVSFPSMSIALRMKLCENKN